MVNVEREWPLFLKAIERTEWLTDELFATPLARFENADLLTTLLGEIFGAEPWAHWDARLSAAGVTYGLVGRITDHIADPQLEANKLLPEFADGYGLKTLDSPFQVAGETKAAPRMAPDVGQHTRAILEEFGGLPALAEAVSAG